MQFRKIAIIGVGLLGGSIGLAAKKRGFAGVVAGFVRRAASLKDCEKAGAVDFATTDVLAAVWDADLVILCTPLAQMCSLTQRFFPALKRNAIITDVGSVKAGIVCELESFVQKKSGAYFIGSHPMTGAEKIGITAARADLFANAVCVVTPTKKSNKVALKKVEQFWKSLGARTLQLVPEQHDLLASRSSHLPHVVAAALVNLVLNPEQPKHQAALCATGFRDTTRIASGSPEMWSDIAMVNCKKLAKSMGVFIAELEKFQHALKRSDRKAIAKFFETAKKRRDNWCASSASTSLE